MDYRVEHACAHPGCPCHMGHTRVVKASELLAYAEANPGVQIIWHAHGKSGVIVEVSEQWLATCRMHTVWVSVTRRDEPMLFRADDRVELAHDREIVDPHAQAASGSGPDATMPDATVLGGRRARREVSA